MRVSSVVCAVIDVKNAAIRSAEVKKYAHYLGRTPGAVAYKLVHFAGMDRWPAFGF